MKKTKSELKSKLSDARFLAIFFVILSVMFSIFYLIEGYQKIDLEEKLHDCQEKCPVSVANQTISFWLPPSDSYSNIVFNSKRGVFLNGKNIIGYGIIIDDSNEVSNLKREIWCEVNEIENCKEFK